MSEILKQTDESSVKYERHAESYASNASVELEPWQKNQYAKLRKLKVDHVFYSEHGPGLWSLSDQQILYLTLHPEQQTAFEDRYSHIDFGHALECYMKWCDYQSSTLETISWQDDNPIFEQKIA